jgi:hypothetical protein
MQRVLSMLSDLLKRQIQQQLCSLLFEQQLADLISSSPQWYHFIQTA